MDKAQALHSFWSEFGIPAYDENSVPDSVKLPYITYESSSDEFGNSLALTASVWYRSSSWIEITEKVMEIAERITRGGAIITYDGGAMWIQRRTPWAQRLGDPSDDTIKRVVLSIAIEYID